MTADKLDHFAEPEETLYEFITRLASAKSDRALGIALGASVMLGTALTIVSPRFCPVIAASGTLATISAGGLLEHRRVLHPGRWVRPTERLLVFLGGALAFVAAMGGLYAALGSGWIH